MDPELRSRAQGDIWSVLGEAATIEQDGHDDKEIAVIWESLDSTEVGDGDPAPKRVEGRRIAAIRRSELGRAIPLRGILVDTNGNRWRISSVARDDGTDIRVFVTASGRDVDTSGPGGH